MAGNVLTDVDEFTDPIVSPGDLEPSSQAVHARGLQGLANRTRNLLNQLGTLPTDFLVANRIYGRASAGNTEGKASTDFSLSLIALATAVLHNDAVHTKGSNIASSATTNIAGATGVFVHITGTTQIDALGTAAAGVVRYLRFADALTLSNNASIILPTADDILTAANDVAIAVSEGGGVWRIASYERASGLPLDISSLAGYVAIESVSDLPTASGGKHTLLADSVYQINGIISLGANYLEVADGTIITGRFAPRDRLVYTGTGGVIRSPIAVTSQLRVERLGIDCTTVGAKAFDCDAADAILDGVQMIGDMWGTFNNCPRVIFRNCEGVEMENGVLLSNSSTNAAFASLFCGFSQKAGAVGTLIDFGSSVWDFVRFSESSLVSVVGGTDIAGLASNGNLEPSTGRGIFADSRIDGAGTHLSGIAVVDAQWSFQDVDGVADTTNLGLVTMTGNATITPLPVQGTLVKVAGTTTLSIGRRFDDDSVTSNRLRYVGAEPRTLGVVVRLGVVKAGATEQGSVQIHKNGSPIGISFPFAVDNKGLEAEVSFVSDVVTNDFFEVFIANNDSTTGITVTDLLIQATPEG